MARVLLWMLVLIGVLTDGVQSHGLLYEPPSRSSMWRRGFNTVANYNDNQLSCGGFSYQWQQYKGKCGICGDPYGGRRDNEAGGKYASGIITRKYTKGQEINVDIQVTANHKGNFEFRICPNNDVKKVATQKCLDQHLLQLADGTGTQYHLQSSEVGHVRFKLKLPSDLVCSQCVLQWKWHVGNSWGTNADGRSCIGCGPQEEFYGCSDVAIVDDDNPQPVVITTDEPTTASPTTTTPRPTTVTPKPTTSTTSTPKPTTATPQPTTTTATPKPTMPITSTPKPTTTTPKQTTTTATPKPTTPTTSTPNPTTTTATPKPTTTTPTPTTTIPNPTTTATPKPTTNSITPKPTTTSATPKPTTTTATPKPTTTTATPKPTTTTATPKPTTTTATPKPTTTTATPKPTTTTATTKPTTTTATPKPTTTATPKPTTTTATPKPTTTTTIPPKPTVVATNQPKPVVNHGHHIGLKCVPVRIWKKLPGMKKWCQEICRTDFCPATHCSCS